jgi:hypothetical protein
MSRAIKFRAWNGESMEYGGFDIHATGKIVNILSPLSRLTESSPLMQFTGMQDSNGKDIYEGDLLECDNDDERFVVEVCWEEAPNYEGWSIDPRDGYNGVIVGNIYQSIDGGGK